MFYAKTIEFIRCDKCGWETLEWDEYDLDYYNDLREKAEAKGWKICKSGKTYCPSCRNTKG